jgi:hypothetical protein
VGTAAFLFAGALAGLLALPLGIVVLSGNLSALVWAAGCALAALAFLYIGIERVRGR